MKSSGDLAARLAGATSIIDSVAPLTVERLRQGKRSGPLADAFRAGKEIGVSSSPGLETPLKHPGGPLLADQATKSDGG
jgi:hypothetical protein